MRSTMTSKTAHLLLACLLTTATASIPSSVPSFAIDFAPVVYLYSGENFQPAPIAAQLTPNTIPELNYSVIPNAHNPVTLSNLDQLNSIPNSNSGANIYLTTVANLSTAFPSFLHGAKPNAAGQTVNATSCAIIVNDHSDDGSATPGVVDVFYMYFYAFDYGGDYFGQNIGNHVGDWEHNMVRFVNGTPTAVWYSQHANGEAFTYAATAKYANGTRPISYSANGTHANYATPGVHDHTLPNLNLPFALIIPDHSDAGTFWDPTLSAAYYRYSAVTGTFTPYDDELTPEQWLYFTGHWGNAMLAMGDPAQKCLFGINSLCRYVGGPTGPRDKQLNRTEVCPSNGNPCIVRSFLTA